MAYQQLTRSERERVEIFHHDGDAPAVIARKIGRSKSTISRELKRNSTSDIGYRGEFAHYYAKHRRGTVNGQLRKIAEGSVLAHYIFDQLRARWSPENIADKLKECRIQSSQKTTQNAIVKDEMSGKVYKFGEIPTVSAKTIYTFIKKNHVEFLQYFSVLSHKKPRPRGSGKKQLIKDRTWIEERPKEAEERKVVGHWEGDTIVSGCRNKAIATMVDRATGFLLAGKMEDRTAAELNRAIQEEMTSLPAIARKTSTKDNGPEFAEHATLAVALAMAIYFAHPYHSWERPVNERTNRELRRFFPKGTDFGEIEEWELDWAVRLINYKPRKRLGNRSPHAVFHEKLSVAL
jgi:transposase, IS30 family